MLRHELIETWKHAAQSGQAQLGEQRWPMLRMTMPDGRQWSVTRRHGMARIMTRRDYGTRRLYLFFEDESGACRRAEVQPDFPEPGQATPDAIRSAWLTADALN